LVAGKVKPKEPTQPKRVSHVRIVHQQTPKTGDDGVQLQFNRTEEAYLKVEVEVDSSVVCEDCGVTVKNLEAHRRKVHGGHPGALDEPFSTSNANTTAPKNPLFTLVQCAVCGSMVGDLAKHMKKAKHVDEAKRRTLMVMQAENGEMICPFCISRWQNRTEVSGHVERAHGKQAMSKLRFELPRRPLLGPSKVAGK
jgi:hypothetical protein